MTMDPQIIPLAMFSPVLVAVAYYDAQRWRRPGLFALAAALLFIASAPGLSWSDIEARGLTAATCFAAALCGRRLGVVSESDARFLACLMLLVPSSGLVVFGSVFCLTVLVGLAIAWMTRKAVQAAQTGWGRAAAPDAVPMGVAMALAGLATLCVGVIAP